MFGNQDLFVLDIIIKIYSIIVSACTLLIYIYANFVCCTEFTHFNCQLRSIISSKAITASTVRMRNIKMNYFQNIKIAEVLETQLTDFLILIKFITDIAIGIIAVSFVSGIIIHLCSLYALRAFTTYLFIGRATFALWTATSILFLVCSTLRFGDFYNLVSLYSELHNIFSMTLELALSHISLKQNFISYLLM